ncbi:MAG: hypothetical protein U9P49_11330 [Thermodesulfobacteriota bacterium]|nr:hypothetical protein [Thermodesulfobacteriota bacterium]
MKIDPNMIIGKTTGQVSHQRHISSGVKFEDILQREKITSTENISRATSPGVTDMAGPLQADKIKGLSFSEQALDLLDKYNKLLADPDVTLRMIAPIVDEMNTMGERLEKASSLLSTDKSLKGIMNDIASTIRSEGIRFNRGDLIG